MAFPTPPPLKDKPLPPELASHLKPKRPNAVMLIIGVSVVFWISVALLLTLGAIALLYPWISRLPAPGVVVIIMCVIAVWYGISIGSRVGTAIIATAMRRTTDI